MDSKGGNFPSYPREYFKKYKKKKNDFFYNIEQIHVNKS